MKQKSQLRWENNFFTFFVPSLRIKDLGQTYLELDSDAWE
jgi:hypothetical protein